ncbi:hypothetical protein BROUX41_001601 [Berkeleyomyces rouxiae]|uniref:uncharacterized protein n=1 Tax=Berkeleyomyces rouxiae TaxID=2035830 RepID=UPI003B7C70FD
MSLRTSFKDIPPVPTSQEFLDIVLSGTQRRLPTQIRSGFMISRIRAFYTRKVKFTQETFSEKFAAILDSFPRLTSCHPFHRDLFNTLYDQDHFKIALGQLSTAKGLIETISRDYVRLIKYAQSLFQCKQLKRAALGRMATICKRLKDPLLYLDQVRQHLGRLPSIDPNTRTLVICGFPNTGKSSFLRSISRADVDVQPYAFTTKSLFVGHFDYKYLRFAAIDTPGILDHSLEEMNTIEMQSVTAIAHLRSVILYFMDLSEQCGYPVQAQINLFKSIKPLFSNKIVFIAINKIDITRPEGLEPELKSQLDAILKPGEVELLELSCNTGEGVQEAKNAACERLIAERVSQKMKAGTGAAGAISGRLAEVMSRIHVATPMGGQTLETFIPEGIKNLKKYDKSDAERRTLARDVEEQNGGAGVFNVDMRADWMLKNDEWKYDKIPEVLDGKNVYDYVDPEIESKLQALEDEEERLEAEGFYESEDDEYNDEEQGIMKKAEMIREKQAMIRNEARMKKRLKNQAIIPRSARKVPLSELEEGLDVLGVDTTSITSRAKQDPGNAPRGRGRSLSRAATADPDAMDMDDDNNNDAARQRIRAMSRVRSVSRMNRREDGVQTAESRSKTERLAKLGQKKMNRMARQGEADRHTVASLTKHLVAGKRGIGKNNRR